MVSIKVTAVGEVDDGFGTLRVRLSVIVATDEDELGADEPGADDEVELLQSSLSVRREYEAICQRLL